MPNQPHASAQARESAWSHATAECHAISDTFNQLGYRAGAWLTPNRKHIELYVLCPQPQADKTLAELGYTDQAGSAIDMRNGEAWYKVWVYPQTAEQLATWRQERG